MKKIEDYLHFYIGCKMKNTKDGTIWTLRHLDFSDLQEWKNDHKPILRPLSDITDKEKDKGYREWYNVSDRYGTPTMRNAAEIKYFLSKHFDLFGLIEAGLAIDATTIKTTA